MLCNDGLVSVVAAYHVVWECVVEQWLGVAFLIPSIQFFFGLPCALFCFGIHFNAILGNLPSAILLQ